MKASHSILTFAVIGMMVSRCVALSLPERLLLPRATKVTLEPTSWETDIYGYRWISNQEAIFHRQYREAKDYLVRLDLSNGVETNLAGWPNDELFLIRGQKLRISPDRQWIFSTINGVDTATLDGGRLDGTHPLDDSKHLLRVGQTFWLSDSVHCLKFSGDAQGRTTCQRFNILHPEEPDSQPIVLPVSDSNNIYYSFDLVSDNHALGYRWFDSDGRNNDITVVDIRLSPKHPTARTSRLVAPPNARTQELEFSPQGNRVAWLVEQEQGSTQTAPINGKPVSSKADTRSVVGIWVCGLNGNHMHEIGHVPKIDTSKYRPGETNSPNPENLQWLPDGTRLSFIYQGALYIVPAD